MLREGLAIEIESPGYNIPLEQTGCLLGKKGEMRKFVLVVGLIVFVGLSAQAQNDYPKVELFTGYSYANTDLPHFTSVVPRMHAHGWALSISGNLRKYFGITADFAGQYGEGDVEAFFETTGRLESRRINFSNHQFLFGPRITGRTERVNAFAHALFGAVHMRSSGFSVPFVIGLVRITPETHFAMGFGGGVDVNAGRRFAIRVFQVDYIPVRWGRAFWLQNVRAQGGIIIKFGGGS